MSGFAIRRKDKYARYAWLIDTLRRHGPCSLREIDRRWVEETNQFSKRENIKKM